jgi:glucose-6-phosphate dehydrogenase assembly protein OpcA
MTTSVEPERLLKELRKLWLDLGKQSPDGVLRACAMTFIVVADEQHDAQAIGETIASLMHEHPSRAIVVRVRRCKEAVLEARVFAQCWRPFGSRQQICSEQVEIIASPESLADVATLLRALVVPDLPVILYSPSETLWWLPQFGSLLALPRKVIVDSCGMADPLRVLGLLSGLPARIRDKADLVWSRLTPWREAIAQIFEPPRRARAAYDLQEIRILFKGAEEPSSVYYMAGWFMHVLGAGVPVRIARGVGPEYAGIAHIALSGPGLEAEVGIVERCTAEVVVNGEAPRVILFPTANDAWALRQELSVGTRDTIFEDVTGLANLLRGAA